MKNLTFFPKLKFVFVFLFALSIFLQSCKKEEVNPYDQNKIIQISNPEKKIQDAEIMFGPVAKIPQGT